MTSKHAIEHIKTQFFTSKMTLKKYAVASMLGVVPTFSKYAQLTAAGDSVAETEHRGPLHIDPETSELIEEDSVPLWVLFFKRIWLLKGAQSNYRNGSSENASGHSSGHSQNRAKILKRMDKTFENSSYGFGVAAASNVYELMTVVRDATLNGDGAFVFSQLQPRKDLKKWFQSKNYNPTYEEKVRNGYGMPRLAHKRLAQFLQASKWFTARGSLGKAGKPVVNKNHFQTFRSKGKKLTNPYVSKDDHIFMPHALNISHCCVTARVASDILYDMITGSHYVYMAYVLFPVSNDMENNEKLPRSYFLAGLPFLEKIFIGDGHNGEAAVQKTCSEIARHYDDLCDSIQQHIVDAQDDESEIDALNVHDMMASHPFWKHMVQRNPAPVCTLDWDSFREEAVVADGAGLNLLVLLSVGVMFKSNQDEWLSNDTSDFQETVRAIKMSTNEENSKKLSHLSFVVKHGDEFTHRTAEEAWTSFVLLHYTKLQSSRMLYEIISTCKNIEEMKRKQMPAIHRLPEVTEEIKATLNRMVKETKENKKNLTGAIGDMFSIQDELSDLCKFLV